MSKKYTFEDLINEGSYDFIDISSEKYRVYTFIREGEAWEYTLRKGVALAISKSGHRVFQSDGVSNFIPSGWISLHWKAKKNKPHYIK